MRGIRALLKHGKGRNVAVLTAIPCLGLLLITGCAPTVPSSQPGADSLIPLDEVPEKLPSLSDFDGFSNEVRSLLRNLKKVRIEKPTIGYVVKSTRTGLPGTSRFESKLGGDAEGALLHELILVCCISARYEIDAEAPVGIVARYEEVMVTIAQIPGVAGEYGLISAPGAGAIMPFREGSGVIFPLDLELVHAQHGPPPSSFGS